MSADIAAGMVAVIAVGALITIGVAIYAAFNPVPADGSPRRPETRDPEATRRVPPEWMAAAAAEALHRRARAAEVAAMFPPPVVAATAPYVAAGRAGRVERQAVTVAQPSGRPR